MDRGLFDGADGTAEKRQDGKLLAEQAADRIVGLIVDRGWESGHKLPNEYELARQLSVSRNTLREAIRALVSRNILEIRRGDGTYIAENCGVSEDPMGLKFIRDKKGLMSDLLELRFMVEPELASMAALNAADSQAGELYRMCREIEKRILRKEPYEQMDIAFHKEIARLSRNILAPNLIPVLNQPMLPFLEGRREEFERDMIETHRDIVTAIQKHDPDEAHDAMYLHLLYARKSLKRNRPL